MAASMVGIDDAESGVRSRTDVATSNVALLSGAE